MAVAVTQRGEEEEEEEEEEERNHLYNAHITPPPPPPPPPPPLPPLLPPTASHIHRPSPLSHPLSFVIIALSMIMVSSHQFDSSQLAGQKIKLKNKAKPGTGE